MKLNTLFPYLISVFSYLSHVDVGPLIFIPMKQEVMDYCLKIPKH